jgi:hypothetical protein
MIFGKDSLNMSMFTKSPAFHLKEKHRPLARTARRSMSLLAFGLLLCLGTGSKAQTPNQNEKLDSAPLVIELTAMVAQHGWVANLGRMCPAMRIGAEADCGFKQISISASPPGTIDNHGFNVQLHSPDRESAIIIFHLGALVGNFFILSRAGELKSAFYRTRGLDYMENSVEEARPAFEASLTFWRENLPKLKELIAAGNLPRR